MTNEQIQLWAEAAFNQIEGPRVGDYVIHLSGKVSRFTYDWGDRLQAGGGGRSFHLDNTGYVTYSGGLTDSIPKSKLELTSEKRPGLFWHFDLGIAGAHRGVEYTLDCRVYREVE